MGGLRVARRENYWYVEHQAGRPACEVAPGNHRSGLSPERSRILRNCGAGYIFWIFRQQARIYRRSAIEASTDCWNLAWNYRKQCEIANGFDTGWNGQRLYEGYRRTERFLMCAALKRCAYTRHKGKIMENTKYCYHVSGRHQTPFLPTQFLTFRHWVRLTAFANLMNSQVTVPAHLAGNQPTVWQSSCGICSRA